jgi:hypothetical protein
VHPLDNVATIVKNAFNILRVNRRRKMRVAIVLVGAGRGRNLQELITNEELDACHQLGLIVRRQLPVFRIGQIVRGEFGKLVFEFTPPILDLLAQQILLVQEQNHRDRLEPAIVPNRLKQ